MNKRAFTVTEVLVTIIIIGILAAMAVAVFTSDYNRQKSCINNLNSISRAIEKYRDDPLNNNQYPPDGLPGSGQSLKDALSAGYISDAAVFKCPADTAPGSTDSYSGFYVKRNNYSSMDAFTLGCPRHEGGNSAMNLFFQGQAVKQKIAAARTATSVLSPDSLVTGRITFADGSVADVTQGSVLLLQSFYIGAGKCYSLLKVAAAPATVECDVTPGSKFEVITPSAIAGVGGTEFRVVVPSNTETYVGIRGGEVSVAEKQGMGRSSVKQREIAKIESGQAPIQIDPQTSSDPYVQQLEDWIEEHGQGQALGHKAKDKQTEMSSGGKKN